MVLRQTGHCDGGVLARCSAHVVHIPPCPHSITTASASRSQQIKQVDRRRASGPTSIEPPSPPPSPASISGTPSSSPPRPAPSNPTSDVDIPPGQLTLLGKPPAAPPAPPTPPTPPPPPRLLGSRPALHLCRLTPSPLAPWPLALLPWREKAAAPCALPKARRISGDGVGAGWKEFPPMLLPPPPPPWTERPGSPAPARPSLSSSSSSPSIDSPTCTAARVRFGSRFGWPAGADKVNT